MISEQFIAYRGLPDFHDGFVLHVHDNLQGSVVVAVKGFSSKEYEIQFSGAEIVVANNPENIELYALSEMASSKKRLFVFANSNEQDSSSLEIIAESFAIQEV